jgi:hypothetical protein
MSLIITAILHVQDSVSVEVCANMAKTLILYTQDDNTNVVLKYEGVVFN